MKRHRVILVILLILLLGAIVNVAVAWGMCKFVDMRNAEHHWQDSAYIRPPHPHHWIISIQRHYGMTSVLSSRTNRILDDYSPAELDLMYEGSVLIPFLPPWSDAATIEKPLEPMSNHIGMELGEGWPYISMTGQYVVLVGGKVATVEYLRFIIPNGQTLSTLSPYYARAYTLKPYWPGFIVNTIFYGMLLWLLIPGPFVFRRFLRARRGHCLKCAYDLRGVDHEACPECGKEIRKANPA